VTARSADPTVAPVIEPGYLHSPRDLERLVAGVEQAQQMFATGPLRSLVGETMYPAPEQTDLVEYVRAGAETLYHPTGTCRMGTDDAAVTDETLRLRGVDNVRVVDASVMPQIIRGHTHAPTVMIAERAADLIRGRA
jgi:choline dehydrogenase